VEQEITSRVRTSQKGPFVEFIRPLMLNGLTGRSSGRAATPEECGPNRTRPSSAAATCNNASFFSRVAAAYNSRGLQPTVLGSRPAKPRSGERIPETTSPGFQPKVPQKTVSASEANLASADIIEHRPGPTSLPVFRRFLPIHELTAAPIQAPPMLGLARISQSREKRSRPVLTLTQPGNGR
jgi:hypothetical protein